MWLDDLPIFATLYRLPSRQARQLQCTAEHLLARRDGGDDSPDNIAAACRFCNAHRHQRKSPPSPLRYRELVSKRLARGSWHQLGRLSHATASG
ncbi:HNH endonuclease [Arenimonas sp.]|uniref:HNH endonuclease n=1 Tax=Arenimonas sp. TaxID=1872635 RepID=UPI0039E611C6